MKKYNWIKIISDNVIENINNLIIEGNDSIILQN